MFGHRSTRVLRLRDMTVHTNLEAVAIMVAAGFAGATVLEGLLIVACFAVGTGLHLACHLGVAVAFGKGIDRMVLTRAGRIDYAGAPPSFVEGFVRTAAGATMNGLCAAGAYAALHTLDTASWAPGWQLALHTFARCSLILTVINFLPAVPLDGGLLLRSVLELRVPVALAARISAVVSLMLMAAIIVVGAVWRQPVLVYLGVVISYDNWCQHLRPARPRGP